MSVVLAALTSDPNLLRCELHRLAGQVLLQGEQRANAVGVGAYAQDEVLLRRFPGEGELSLDSLAPPNESEALLFHSGRLPVGMQVLGRHHEDALLFDVALAVEREAPWPLVASSVVGSTS